MPDVSIAVGSQFLPAYLAVPPEGSSWPGVVVIHDVFGMDADPRRQADWLAAAGYFGAGTQLILLGQANTLSGVNDARLSRRRVADRAPGCRR
jgi:carboxymethylenebutenolidase